MTKNNREIKILLLAILIIGIIGFILYKQDNYEISSYKRRGKTENKENSDMIITYKEKSISLEIRNGTRAGIYQCIKE